MRVSQKFTVLTTNVIFMYRTHLSRSWCHPPFLISINKLFTCVFLFFDPQRYLRFVTKNFVRENDTVRWCPTPGCSHAITFDQGNSTSDSAVVQCVCGYRFCFKCHHEAHAPATCDHMKLWDKEAQIFDCMNFSYCWELCYLQSNAGRAINCRECPKCNVSVEKNGGCNHMVCFLREIL